MDISILFPEQVIVAVALGHFRRRQRRCPCNDLNPSFLKKTLRRLTHAPRNDNIYIMRLEPVGKPPGLDWWRRQEFLHLNLSVHRIDQIELPVASEICRKPVFKDRNRNYHSTYLPFKVHRESKTYSRVRAAPHLGHLCS